MPIFSMDILHYLISGIFKFHLDIMGRIIYKYLSIYL